VSLLALRAASVSLGGAQVLSAVDFEFAGGEMVGLIGANGAGKTTLLRVLAGLLRPGSGELHLDGRPAAAIERRRRARLIGYLPQGGESHWAVSVETLVMTGRLPHLGPWRGPGPADRAAVRRALEICDVAGLAGRPVTALSGGERARVLLARALAGEPRILLADEPVADLDPAHQLDVMETLRALAGEGAGVVVVMHDLSLAARFCDRLVMLLDGRVAAAGAAREVLSAEVLGRCLGIRVRQGAVDGIPYVVPIERC